MQLSLNSLYEPFQKFFLDKFKENGNQQFQEISFCFDSLAQSASGENFLSDPNDPNSYNETVAKSFFSGVVNKIPVVSEPFVTFKIDEIGDFYKSQIIDSATVSLEGIADENLKNKKITDFYKQKNEIDQVYSQYTVPDEFAVGQIFANASPAKWYDNRINNWTSHTISISQTTTKITGNSKYDMPLWRSIKNPELLIKSIDNQLTKPLPKSVNKNLMKMTTVSMAHKLNQPLISTNKPQAAFSTLPMFMDLKKVNNSSMNSVMANTPKMKSNTKLSARYIRISNLEMSSSAVNTTILNNTVNIGTTAQNLSLSFKYQLITIDRPWLNMIFLKRNDWYISGKKKFQLINDLSHLPIGFVVIKDLLVTGNWSQADIENSKSSYGFGPFVFQQETSIINGSLKSEGIHIVGWILQKMPLIPFVDAPNS